MIDLFAAFSLRASTAVARVVSASTYTFTAFCVGKSISDVPKVVVLDLFAAFSLRASAAVARFVSVARLVVNVVSAAARVVASAERLLLTLVSARERIIASAAMRSTSLLTVSTYVFTAFTLGYFVSDAPSTSTLVDLFARDSFRASATVARVVSVARFVVSVVSASARVFASLVRFVVSVVSAAARVFASSVILVLELPVEESTYAFTAFCVGKSMSDVPNVVVVDLFAVFSFRDSAVEARFISATIYCVILLSSDARVVASAESWPAALLE